MLHEPLLVPWRQHEAVAHPPRHHHVILEEAPRPPHPRRPLPRRQHDDGAADALQHPLEPRREGAEVGLVAQHPRRVLVHHQDVDPQAPLPLRPALLRFHPLAQRRHELIEEPVAPRVRDEDVGRAKHLGVQVRVGALLRPRLPHELPAHLLGGHAGQLLLPCLAKGEQRRPLDAQRADGHRRLEVRGPAAAGRMVGIDAVALGAWIGDNGHWLSQMLIESNVTHLASRPSLPRTAQPPPPSSHTRPTASHSCRPEAFPCSTTPQPQPPTRPQPRSPS
mmetsp:Transcript_74540/g.199302  ORF Transcript_74540/g.199302 Transcript_74540/m.199302 type:complete len:278 (-) Transcript_74540:54-887(-)